MSRSSKIIRITSEDQDTSQSESNGEFTCVLKDTTLTQRVKGYTVQQVWADNVYYNISAGTAGQMAQNNTINITETTGYDGDVSIAEGQYSVTQFMAAWITALDAKLTGTTTAIVQDPVTNKVTLTFTGNTVALNTDYPAGNLTFGFNAAVAAAASWTAPYLPKLGGLKELYVHSKTVSNGNLIDADFGSISTLACVSFHDVPYGSTGYLQTSDTDLYSVTYPSPRNLSTIKIQLRDSNGRKLDPGASSSVTIMIKCYFAN